MSAADFDPQHLIARYGLVAATLVVSFISGLVPIVNTEIYLVAVAALTRSGQLPEVVAVAAVGQMLAKSLFYLAGRGFVRLPLGRYQSHFDEWTIRLGRSKRGVDLVMFSSSLWGVPPFLVVPYLAGAFRLSFLRFMLWGLLGRFLRFAGIIVIPALLKHATR